PAALVTFAAGVAGALGVGLVGRSAQARARSAREHFAKVGRKLRLELRPDIGEGPRDPRPSSSAESASTLGRGPA
ncbi:MAG TPA: hypothetical protein VFQ61_27950, partial [Polyangiaceae bacterium]|nr:hypothetical protein [Polyangiaceae bacterium]